MCGIVGVLGSHEVAPLLVESLKRLEYRGYDSAGIATVDGGVLDRRRAVGKLVNLSDRLVHEPLTGKTGIGHTRWATHGAPSETNAHPHRAGHVAVVHNGIIENYRELRAELGAGGAVSESETDTETVALLTRAHLDQGLSHLEAVRATLARLEGAFALLFLFEGEDDLMIAARKGSPLAIGWGAGEMFVGSDAIALAPMTDRITYLDEGDHAVITRAGAEIYDAAGKRANRPTERVELSQAAVEKGGYKHFMAKEIAEQPAVIDAALNAYLDGGALALPGLDFTGIERLTMVACGTGYYACQTAKYWFEQIAGLPVETDVASEFRYREPPVSPGTMAVMVSQSGETADTLAALRFLKGRAAQIVSVTNVASSSIAREADLDLQIRAGVEISVASTKAFTSQLLVLALMAVEAGRQRGVLNAAQVADYLDQLRRLPGLLNQALAIEGDVEALSERVAEASDVLFLGRGPMSALAMEGALKLKELSYIHAEGYASGELKHGPIALVDRTLPVIVLAPRDGLFDKTVSNMQEVMARHGQVLLVSDADGISGAGEGCWATLRMPAYDSPFAPILYAVPVQQLAYHSAMAKGTDVDQPRNLAKSVTVE